MSESSGVTNQSPQIAISNITNLVTVKLNQENYLLWKYQMMNVLKTLGLEKFIDSSILPPPVSSSEFTKWIKTDAYVTMCLNATMEASVAHIAVDADSASKLWSIIEETYLQHAFAKKSYLMTQFQTLKQGTLTVNAYCDEIKRIADSLRSIGDPITDLNLVLRTLNGLNQSFNPFVLSIENSDKPPSFAQLRSRLLVFEERMSQQDTSSGSISAMNSTTQFSAPHHNLNKIEDVKCQICKKEGHEAWKCYHRFTLPTQSQSKGGFRGGGSGNSRRGNSNWRGNSGRGGNGGRNWNRGSANWNHRGGGGENSAYVAAQWNPNSYPTGQWNPSPNFEHGLTFKSGPSQYNGFWAHNLSGGHGTNGPQYFVPNQSSTSGGPSFGPHHFSEWAAQQPWINGDQNCFAQNSQNGFVANLSVSSACDLVDTWVTDSGATTHMTSDPTLVKDARVYTGQEKVVIGDGTFLNITHIGHTTITLPKCTLKLNHVLLVPGLTKNLLSIPQLVFDNPCIIEFSYRGFLLKTLTGLLLHHIPRNLHNVYALSATTALSSSLWHSRLGHPSDYVLHVLSFLRKNNKVDVCHACNISKSSRLPFSNNCTKSNSPLEIVHSDIWGPSPTTSRSGFRYYISFIDDYSRFTWLYPLTHRSQALESFKHFKNHSENLFSTTIKYFQCDGAPELTQGQMRQFLSDSGITYRISCPYTPQQNGVAERKNRHLSEIARALLFHAQLPSKFWYDAYATAAFIINRIPSQSLDHVSPYEILFKIKPAYSLFRTFGCLCYPFLGSTRVDKLSPKSVACIFLGYAPNHKGYLCYDTTTTKTYTSRHVVFHETVFPIASLDHVSSPSVVNLPTFPSSSTLSPHSPPTHTSSSTSTHTHSPLHTSSSTTSSPSPPPPPPPLPSHPMITRSRDHTRPVRTFSDHVLYQAHTHSDIEPSTFGQAKKWSVWWDAMNVEISALHSNQTWVLVPLPPNANIVGCKWVYKIKRNPDGSVSRYKARLVAKGFNQTEGIDYTETFSPVVKPTTIRLVLSIAYSRGWDIRQVDVNNAFLHGDLSESVYMEQPPGFVDPSRPQHVCLLKKALYGLKQAPRAWFAKLSTALLSFGFTQCVADTSLFVYSTSGSTCYVLVYVDDIIITGSSSTFVADLIRRLDSQFALKDLGTLNYFLGIQASFAPDGLHLTQQRYLLDLLHRTGLSQCKPLSSPVSPGRQLSRFAGVPMDDPLLYRSTVGALQYLVLTRPDIAYAVSKVSQFLQTPTDRHWIAVKRILRYLRGTSSSGLHIRRTTDLSLHAYADADWAGCPDDRRSTSGFSIFLGSNLISWSSKKQHIVARSSTEAEYRALAHTSTEIRWLLSLLSELRVTLSASPTLWCDNIGATYLAANPVFHQRTKHIEIDLHFIRDMVLSRMLQIRYVPTSLQIADIQTKGLPASKFQFLRSKLHIIPDVSIAGGC